MKIISFLKKLHDINKYQRDIWVIRQIKSLQPGTLILDAGAGEAPYKKYTGHLNYVSQDFNKYDGQGNKKGMQTGEWSQNNISIVSDISDIPVSTEYFDSILCTEVLEHVPDPVKVLSEFQRILKPGGNLIITVPFASLTHFAPYHFFSGFNTWFFEKHLNDFGFECIEIHKNGSWFEYMIQEIKRTPMVVLLSIKGAVKNNKSEKFVKAILFLIVLLASAPLLILFFIMSLFDNTSRDLLCFGLFIRARKSIK